MSNISILRGRTLKSGLPRQCGRRRGSGLIEFAMVSPFLLAMVLGIIDFGWRERNTLIVANAAREGARVGALGQPKPDIKTRIINASAPLLEADAQGNVLNGSIEMEAATADGNSPTYANMPDDEGSPARNGVKSGRYLRIKVTYNHRSLTGLFSGPISIPVVMRRET